MVYSATSSKEVIVKVHRDRGVNLANFHADAIEWVGEALGLIGTVTGEAVVEKAVPVINHTAQMPSPMTALLAVMYVPSATPRNELETDLEYQDRILSLPTLRVERNGGMQPAMRNQHSYATNYSLGNGFIHLNEEEGAVVFLYKTPPVDEEGYPMVPDHQSFREALKWYISLRLAERGIKHPAGLSYEKIEYRWLKYCSQARAVASFPDLDMMERIRDVWVRVNPDLSMMDGLMERPIHKSPITPPGGTYGNIIYGT